GYLPTVLAVRAKELSVGGRTLRNVVVGGSRDGRVWRANVDADELNGYLEYRQPQSTGAGRVYARLARLTIAASAATEVESFLEQQPASIPALDIVVEEFELKGRALGRLEIDAINRGPGTVVREGGIREWRLNKLSLGLPEATFTASGNWAAVGAQPVAPGGPRQPVGANERRRTSMKFRLDIGDAGQLLNRLGMKDVVRRGRGQMEGVVSWDGSPLAFDYPTLTGNFHVNVESGQFLKADPGLAKLLGVLSLQSLPRRLTLDFRDVFSDGFAFDFVRGDVNIEQGIAATNNLQMKGVNAAVLMEGKADIARETQDLKVVVVPEINAGTASLVATVINPAIGLGTFLAQMFLRQPLIKAATQEFHVDGTWTDPRITRVSRSPAPETTGAAEAPAEATTR
ncbi:MAG TPA: AsmA-like C-terminal region-containing protein, partial [Ramlibacter sp.]